jgi:hypothetical protein
MNNTSTLSHVSNGLLLDELRRRLNTGWQPSDSAYVADLILQLQEGRVAVAADVAVQVMNETEATRARKIASARALDPGQKEIYDWLSAHGYSDEAARSFIQRLPENN